MGKPSAQQLAMHVFPLVGHAQTLGQHYSDQYSLDLPQYAQFVISHCLKSYNN